LLGAVHKRHPQLGGLSSAEFFGQVGLQKWTAALFGAKNLEF